MAIPNHAQQNKEIQKSRSKAPSEEELVSTKDDLSSNIALINTNPNALSPNNVLQLQAQLGNQATMRLLGVDSTHTKSVSDATAHNTKPTFGGLMDVSEDEDQVMVGGVRKAKEAIGDFFRPIGTGVGNAIGSIAGALTAVKISSTTNSGPDWNDHGHFDWRVGFSTTGTEGWIVQEITNTYRAEDGEGNDITGNGIVPHYYEAWAVDNASVITPAIDSNNDYWIRAGRGDDTKGHWSMEGKVHFTKDNPEDHGFVERGVSNAGILLSALTDGGMDLGVARLHRYAQGTWDSTGDTPTHQGSAK